MKTKLIIQGVLLVCCLKQVSLAQSNWNQRNSMLDYGRHVAVSFSIDGLAYVGLGEIWDGSRPVDFWEYNKIPNLWTQKNNFPGGGRYAACSFSINGKGYVCMGLDEGGQTKNDLWEYNPSFDTWVKKENFPGLPRYGATSFVIGDSAFICSGSQGGPNSYLHDLWVYYPGNDSWKRKKDFPGGTRSHATAFSLYGIGFFGTGLYNSNTPTRDFWKYDPTTDNWSQISDIPGQPRLGCVSFVVDNEAYVGLGYDQTIDYNTFYKFNSEFDQWELLPVEDDIIPRRGSSSFTIENIGYFCTGETSFGLLSDLWAYKESPWVPYQQLSEDIPFSLFPNPGREIINFYSSNKFEGEFISFYSLIGCEVFRKKITETSFQIDISNLPFGTYFARISNHHGFLPIKFVKI